MLSYFYIIKFCETNQYYAGSRYTKKLTEVNIKNDLWTRYFTSSKIIKMLINLFGKNSFKVVRTKIFYDTKSAKDYEIRFLRKVDAKNNPKMLNQSNSVFENSPELQWITNGIISTMIPKGKPLFPGFRFGRTQKITKQHINRGPKNKIHVIDIETNDRLMIPKESFDSKKHKKPDLAYNRNRIWINNPITKESKIIKQDSTIPTGWVKGNPRRQKTTWYHDPHTKINYQIKNNEYPPSNLVKGRFYPFIWYTCPLTNNNVLCKIDDQPPIGYVKGRNLSMKGHA